MKRVLTEADVELAVLGGTILGGGGGGHIAAGLESGRLATSAGQPELITVDELDEDDLVVVCAAVGAPGAPDQFLTPAHYLRALEELQRQISVSGLKISALVTNENGALGTVNGWFQAAITGLPLLDAACNGRAHPTALMGSLGLHRDAGYRALAGYAGGRPGLYVQGSAAGSLGSVSQVVRQASITAGGIVAVARNPVPVSRLLSDGAVGAISQAIKLGSALQDQGVAGVANFLGGEIVATGGVTELSFVQASGFDVGRFRVGEVTASIVNEYLSAERNGQTIATFPDLVMTFHEGRPLVSADLAEGMEVTVITAPQSSLLLSSTMQMPELMEPMYELLAGKTPAGAIG